MSTLYINLESFGDKMQNYGKKSSGQGVMQSGTSVSCIHP